MVDECKLQVENNKYTINENSFENKNPFLTTHET